MTARLSPRDRAALTLALHCLRDDDSLWSEVTDSLTAGSQHGTAWKIEEALEMLTPSRILRARLALLLRALLRADAGDVGRMRCEHCGGNAWVEDFDDHVTDDDVDVPSLLWWCARERMWRRAVDGMPYNADGKAPHLPFARRSRRITPWWERAPHTAARPAGLRRRGS